MVRPAGAFGCATLLVNTNNYRSLPISRLLDVEALAQELAPVLDEIDAGNIGAAACPRRIRAARDTRLATHSEHLRTTSARLSHHNRPVARRPDTQGASAMRVCCGAAGRAALPARRSPLRPAAMAEMHRTLIARVPHLGAASVRTARGPFARYPLDGAQHVYRWRCSASLA